MVRILFLNIILLSSVATAREYVFERITSHDGLSQNNVLSIYQCADGYMWFATYDGLNRYDGYDFKVYRSSANRNSLSSNLLHSITEDNQNNLWIGTFNDGACRFNKKTEQFTVYRNTPELPDLLTHNAIYNILCDKKGNVWLCSKDGLNHFEMLNGEVVKVTKFKNTNDPQSLTFNNAQRIFEDSEGRILVSNSFRLDMMKMGENGEIQNVFYHLTDSSIYTDIQQVLEIEGGYLFAHYTGIGMIKFNPEDPENSIIIPLETHASQFIQLDSKGNLWSAASNGLYMFEYRPRNEIPYVLSEHFIEGETNEFLSNQVIRSLLIDKNDMMWIGTNSAGFMKCGITSSRFRHYKKTTMEESIANNKIWNIFEDQFHNLWFSTEGAGLNLLPANKKKNYHSGFQRYAVNPPGEQNFAFQVIDYTKNGIPHYFVGAGFNNRIVEVIRQNNDWHVRPFITIERGQVMALCKDENETVWFGTYGGGLYRYKPNATNDQLANFHPNNSSFPSLNVRSITEDSKGRIWIGTDVGLNLLTADEKIKDNPNFKVFKHIEGDTTSISNSYSVPVIETSNGEIWIGTFGGGLNMYIEGSTETNGTFKKLDIEDGLPNNTIKQIIEDDYGNLWITSNHGLSHIDTSRTKIRNFDVNDGLQDMEFTDLSGTKLSDGEIIIGGVNGFNAFYPDEIFEDTIPPKLVFNDLEIMNSIISVNESVEGNIILNKTVNTTEEITLHYNQNSFTIYFSAIHYLKSEGNQFKYMLDGFDNDWIQTSYKTRFARYTNIEAGTYAFKLMAANSHGVWTKTPKVLTIIIKPPFWETWWFICLSIISMVCVVFFIFYWRTQQMRKRNEELEHEVEMRTREIKRNLIVLHQQADELNATNTELEERQQRIEEQAEELLVQKETLEEQRDILREVNSVKDKLFSIVAHDLKNPFTTLLGFLDVLDVKYEKYTDEKRKAMLGYALSSAKNIQTLLINLLTWARSQSGTIRFKPEVVDIIDIVNTNIQLVANQASEKHITIEFPQSNLFISLNIDADLIDTVVRNLLTNAIKFTPSEGFITLNCLDSEKQVTLSVKDSGIGISRENLKKLFKKDTHFTTYGTNNETGTGLGLITCKDFIEMHNGTITVDSDEGKGTTFTFVLPKYEMFDTDQ